MTVIAKLQMANFLIQSFLDDIKGKHTECKKQRGWINIDDITITLDLKVTQQPKEAKKIYRKDT